MNKPDIKQVLELLKIKYGRRQPDSGRDPLAVLVETILSQNTADTNSRPAFKALISTFGSWENLMQADTLAVAGAIRRGGLGQIKALRIQQALSKIQSRRGQLDLGFLGNLPVKEAREWLKELPGVGNKTANCVLLFALGKPALPVDTHIYRVSKRLGLIGENASLEEAHILLERLVLPEYIYPFHVLMIEHGRQTCIARKPRCPSCILKHICPSFETFMGHPAAGHEKKNGTK